MLLCTLLRPALINRPPPPPPTFPNSRSLPPGVLSCLPVTIDLLIDCVISFSIAL